MENHPFWHWGFPNKEQWEALFKELGINVIYLTPIFKSNSNHKYDIIDYYEIDEIFGTKDEFKRLVKELHSNNIKIVLDAVFNHSGIDFFAFKDLCEKGEKSKYKDWFHVKKLPIDIEGILSKQLHLPESRFQHLVV